MKAPALGSAAPAAAPAPQNTPALGSAAPADGSAPAVVPAPQNTLVLGSAAPAAGSAPVAVPAPCLQTLTQLGRDLLLVLGENPDREGLRDTPRRWAAWWQEFIAYEPGNMETTFESVTTDQMVIVSGIRVWSLCEHHLLPFWADVTIGYITDAKVLGLSKFARIAQMCAHRLQLQERLVQQIADEVQRVTQSANVAIYARGQHLCMTMRGIRSEALMHSSVMRGCFLTQPEARAEFLALARA